MVAQHFPALGFADIAADDREGQMFALDLDAFQPQALPFAR
jgi:hypothetical protein